MDPAVEAPASKGLSAALKNPALPYALPFVVFITITAFVPYMPGHHMVLYAAKTVVVMLLAIALVSRVDLGEGFSVTLPALTGIAVLGVWIGLEGTYPQIGQTSALNPLEGLPFYAVAALAVIRLFGAAVVVPVVEEFFWRGFLLRWIIRPDFRQVRHGTFTWPSFLVTTGLFAVEHHRWLPGLIAGAAYNAIYYRTKSLKACVVAHAATNLGLGVYVLVTGRWEFW